MRESLFVEDLKKSAKKISSEAFVYKISDSFTLGIPDLLFVIDGKVYFIEAKFIQHVGMYVLKYPFKGPQISIMRQVRKAGGFSYGVIGTPNRMLWLIHPCDIPSSGNFSIKGLQEIAFPVFKKDHIWRIDQWENLFYEYGKQNLLSAKKANNLNK